jgi:RNA polymerase sigma-70 factor (ECF subfamily)
MAPSTEDQIVAYLRQQDQRAVPLVYKKYARALLGIAAQIVKDPETAEDVLQEALVKIWRNGPQYDASKGRLFTWMLNIVRNSAIDKVRSKAFRQQAANIQSVENFVSQESGGYSFPIETIGLRDLLNKLELKHREVVEVVYFGGRTHQEAAEELGIPLGTLKTRMRSALLELRKYL